MTYGIKFERLRDRPEKDVVVDTDLVALCDSEDLLEVKLATVESVLAPTNLAIANLTISQGTQDTAISTNALAIANLTISQGTQDTAIGNNASAIANLEASQGSQDTAISLLNAQSGITADVDIYFTDTRPLLNSKGLPLKNGDLWKKKGEEWGEFDAVQWTGGRHYLASTSTFGSTSAFALPLSVPFKVVESTPRANIKIISLDIHLAIYGAVLNSNNRYFIESIARAVSGSEAAIVGASYTFDALANNDLWQRLIENRVLSNTSLNSLALRITRVGSPSVISVSHQICYAHVL
jgi:hypothetical protein